MTINELTRLEVLQKVKDKRLNQKQAAESLGLSLRQIKRLCKKYRLEGPKGLVSKKRGAKGNHRLPDELKEAAVKNILETYPDFGPTFAHEKLTEIHGLGLSVGSVRNLMIANGIWIPRKIRRKTVHQLRERRAREGELIQIDGSPHDWFLGRAPKCNFLAYIDDATGKILEGKFVDAETTWNYMDTTRSYILKHGRPVAMYSDRHSIFRVNKPEALSGTGLTQFGRALDDLGIAHFCANTPQAKGRVERLNRTLQDRLTKELRLRNITTFEEANSYLPLFIEDYNKRFGRVPKSPIDAHRDLPQKMNLDQIFTIQETRHLSKNLTMQYYNKIYQIKTKIPTYALRNARVTVFENRQGEIFIEYKGRRLEYTIYEERPYQKEVVSSKLLNDKVDECLCQKYKPSRKHPWKRWRGSKEPDLELAIN